MAKKNYFDGQIAENYDLAPDIFSPAVVDPAVSFLADLAGDGAALELGIGTGRIALPLSQRGVRVHGIELSPAMVAQLQAKSEADNIAVTSVTSRPSGWMARSGLPTSCTTPSPT
jgi:ubiquinone/menaquinone biosynthesis C-methylase UbiE